MIPPPCTCEAPGFCARHNVDKGPTWFALCRIREDYRRAWDEGRGPGQPACPSPTPRTTTGQIAARPAPAVQDCPIIGERCEAIRVNLLSLFCTADLATIPGSCGAEKRARAVAMLALRLAGKAPPCRRQGLSSSQPRREGRSQSGAGDQ